MKTEWINIYIQKKLNCCGYDDPSHLPIGKCNNGTLSNNTTESIMSGCSLIISQLISESSSLTKVLCITLFSSNMFSIIMTIVLLCRKKVSRKVGILLVGGNVLPIFDS